MLANRHILGLASAVLLAVFPAKALAVISVTLTMADLYETAGEVVVGEVVKADVKSRAIEVRNVERSKGTGARDGLTLNFAAGVAMPSAQPGGPVILFVGRRGTAIHLADGWLAADRPAEGSSVWQVSRNDGPTANFPGTTAALLRVIEDVKAGKKTLLNSTDHNIFKGGIRKLADLKIAPKAIATADVNGDGWPDVLVVGEAGSDLFLNRSAQLTATPGSLSEASGLWAAAGDIDGDGLPDFFVGDAIWLNRPDGFQAEARLTDLPVQRVIAASVEDADGDGLADIVLATETGEIFVYTNPGSADSPWTREVRQLWAGGEPAVAAALSKTWGDDGSIHLLAVRARQPLRYAIDGGDVPPADHMRLAGEPPSWASPWEILGGAMLDVEGNGLPDFYASGRDFGAVLHGRGFGTFLSNYTAKRIFGPEGLEWGRLTRETVLGGADLAGDKCEDLLVATEDGRLFAVENRDGNFDF